MTAIAVCAITHSECYWRTVFYLIVDPTACMAHTSPQYEHHWPTTGWLCVIRSWAGSWHRLWTCPVCVLLTKGLWAAPDRIVNDLWYVVEMTAGLCVHLPHVFYVRFVRVWLLIAIRYGSWYCLQIAPFWLLSAIGLRYIYIYMCDSKLRWALTMLVRLPILIHTYERFVSDIWLLFELTADTARVHKCYDCHWQMVRSPRCWQVRCEWGLSMLCIHLWRGRIIINKLSLVELLRTYGTIVPYRWQYAESIGLRG